MDPQPPGNHLQTPADLLVGPQSQGDSPGSTTWEIFHKSPGEIHTNNPVSVSLVKHRICSWKTYIVPLHLAPTPRGYQGGVTMELGPVHGTLDGLRQPPPSYILTSLPNSEV